MSDYCKVHWFAFLLLVRFSSTLLEVVKQRQYEALNSFVELTPSSEQACLQWTCTILCSAESVSPCLRETKRWQRSASSFSRQTSQTRQVRWLKCGVMLSLKLCRSLLRPKGYEGVTLLYFLLLVWSMPFFCCRHIFLFDAAVIVCKRRGDNYEMKEVIDLHSFKITNNPTSERENRKVRSRSPNCRQSSLHRSRGQQMCCYAVVP